MNSLGCGSRLGSATGLASRLLANGKKPLHGQRWRAESMHIDEQRDDARGEQLRRILAIGHDASNRGAGMSLCDALNLTRYRKARAGLQKVDLLRVIETEPELVEQWIAYSQDKRTDGGWYILRDGEIGKVGAPEARLRFSTIEEAVAEYVIKELDFWAGVK